MINALEFKKSKNKINSKKRFEASNESEIEHNFAVLF